MTGTSVTPMPCQRSAPDTPSRPPSLAGRRVVVTGARGFIGRHLLAHLLDVGADVHAVARPGHHRLPALHAGAPGRSRVSWHEADLSDTAGADRAIRASDPEIVFHLASRVAGVRSPDVVAPMLENNTRAAVNVMTAAHELGRRRVILAGSVEEPHGASEAPCSPYAAAKLAATGYARLFHRQWGLPVTVLRPAMVYGPSQPDETKLVPYVIGRMLEGRPPSLSSGARLIDWVHVDDVCRAFLLAATAPSAPGLVVDIGSGAATTIADTVGVLAALTGYDGPIGYGDLPDRPDDGAHIADPGPASDALGWRPLIGLHEGLAQTVQWHVSRRDAAEEWSAAAGGDPRDRGPRRARGAPRG